MCCGLKKIQRPVEQYSKELDRLMPTTAAPSNSGVSGVMLTYESCCVSQENVLEWTVKILPTQSSPLLCW